ncbi:hypothetical protein Q7P37_009495 [Cladosporium fusiforme]
MNRGNRGGYSRGGYNSRYSSSRGRGGSNRGGTRSTALKGIFADGIWHCNCTPRLPAEHFKVKKEGKNQGRWFYTCQNQQPQRCDFFLWDEDAKLREEGAVLNNSRTETPAKKFSAPQDGWSAGRTRSGAGGMFAGIDPMTAETFNAHTEVGDESTDEGSPPASSFTQSQRSNGSKRKADEAFLSHNDNDEELFWPLTGQEEQDLVEAADTVAALPQTPRKVAKTGVFATPATTVEKRRNIPWLQEPQTANTTPETPTTFNRQQSGDATSPSKSPSKLFPPISEKSYAPTPTLQAASPSLPMKSPSPPTRKRDALSNPADGSSSLTTEALATLSSVSIPPDILDSLRGVLSKHDLKAQGVLKGRDISRLAIKAKEAKIVELHAKIASLEAEREVDKTMIKGLRWEGENSTHVIFGEE